MRKVNLEGARRGEILSYRRGVLLGMTMAEIMILLLFCILMAFVLRLEAFSDEEAKDEEVTRLIDAISKSGGDISDTWTAVRAASSIISVVGEHGLNEIKETVENSKFKLQDEIIDGVIEGLTFYEKLVEQLTEQIGGEPSEDQISGAIEEALRHQNLGDIINKLESLADENNIPPEQIDEFVDDLLSKAKIADRLSRALDKAEDQLAGKGQGLVYPSCFVDESDAIQYVYDVFFDEAGVRLEPIPVVGYDNEINELAFSQVTISSHIPIEQYITETEPLFLWSEQNKCRFFVKIYDQTAAQHKSRYKYMKRRIEYSFYTREMELRETNL